MSIYLKIPRVGRDENLLFSFKLAIKTAGSAQKSWPVGFAETKLFSGLSRVKLRSYRHMIEINNFSNKHSFSQSYTMHFTFFY